MPLIWPKARNPPKLLAGEAHVWAVPVDQTDSAQRTLLATLTPAERTRADEFRFERPRSRFIVTRGALRILLGHHVAERPEDISFGFEGIGKPKLTSKHGATDLRFNVSHSGELALVALCLGVSVGIDVEQMRNIGHLEQIARRFFHPAEVDAVLAAPPGTRNDAFLRCWTAKEAVLKAYGTGIAGSLDAFQVPVADSFEGAVDLSAMPRLEQGSQCWLRRLAPCDDYLAAVAFAGADRRLCCQTFQFDLLSFAFDRLA